MLYAVEVRLHAGQRRAMMDHFDEQGATSYSDNLSVVGGWFAAEEDYVLLVLQCDGAQRLGKATELLSAFGDVKTRRVVNIEDLTK